MRSGDAIVARNFQLTRDTRRVRLAEGMNEHPAAFAQPKDDAVGFAYDAIPGPFQLLSVPTSRSPVEHLDALRLAVDAQGERVFRPYAANYHEISSAPARPPRRTVLLLDAAAEPELARGLDLVRRVAEERDFGVRRLDGAAIATLWGGVARVGASYLIHAGYAEGPDMVAALHLGRRWSGMRQGSCRIAGTTRWRDNQGGAPRVAGSVLTRGLAT